MLTRVLLYIIDHSALFRSFVFRRLFEYLGRRYRHLTDWTYMNYGYAEGPGQGHTIALQPADEDERYSHQLYFRAVDGIDLTGKHVVEVSCGRGGGACFVQRYLRPRTLIGVDIAASAIEFCERVHRVPGLRFMRGEAEHLPLEDNSADVIINVEASLCYGDRDRFFSEVCRVLRPGGHFCYADFQRPDSLERLIQTLQTAGFDFLRAGDITGNVLLALQIDSDRRIERVRTNAPWWLRSAMRVFVGARGTRVPTVLKDGTMGYYSLTLSKRAAQKPTNALAHLELESL